MADIDLAAFAQAVAGRLALERLSYGVAVTKWPSTNKAMWSRVHRLIPLTAGNFVLVCKLLELSPVDFLREEKTRRVTRKTIVKQAVTVVATRETERVAP